MQVSFTTVEELRKFLGTRGGKLEVVEFINNLRAYCEAPTNYAHFCAAASAAPPLGGNKVAEIFDVLVPFMEESRPGHDIGHFYRDFLTGLVIVANDSYVASAAYEADVWAGLLSAGFHDVAIAAVPRYLDGMWEAGHAEVGAWLFYELTTDIIPEELRLLTAYAIAAHKHFLKDEEVSEPISSARFIRHPYDDEIFDVDGRPCRLAVTIARAADRLDTNGASHWARHVAAMADAKELEGAKDFSGDSYFEIDEVAFRRLLLPEIAGGGAEGAPTTLKHMQNFANSNYNADLPFARYDDRFPMVRLLIDGKVGETRNMLMHAQLEYEDTDFVPERAWDFVSEFIEVVCVVSVDDTLDVLCAAWNSLTLEQQLKLFHVVEYAESAYKQWLATLISYITDNKGVPEALRELAEGLMEDLWYE